MNILDILKLKKRKSKSTVSKVSVDDQLERLACIGIQPKDKDFLEWIYNEWGKGSRKYMETCIRGCLFL